MGETGVHSGYGGHCYCADELIDQLRQSNEELHDGLSWALDLIDLYDGFLVELGEPRDKVYDVTHTAGMAKARKALLRLGGEGSDRE